MRAISWVFVLALGLGCERAPAALTGDAASPTDLSLPQDTAVDAPPAPVDTGLVPVAPYDAGEAPGCTREAVFRRVATRAEGVRDISVGGVVPYRGGFVVAVHESAPRLTLDAGSPRRDAIGVLAVDHDAQVQRPLELVYASAATQTDLTVPALIPLGEGALVTFGESRGSVGAAGSVLRLRGAVLDAGAVPGVPAALLEDHGEGAVTPLPDGRALLLTSRVRSVSDGGVLVVSPSTYRVDVQGRVNPGQDITASVRLDSESLLLRPAPDGAVLFSRLGNDLLQLSFDRDGSVDLRGARRTANLGARRLDDAAVLGDVSVIAWGSTEEGVSVVRAAVVNRDGGVIARRELDRFTGPEPIVAVAPAFGGAAVAWLRGVGDTITIRATTLQPDGLVRNAPRDVVRAPRAGGRLHMVVGEGARVATFAAQDIDADGVQGVSLGRSCLP
jgi:hypothetical protein